MRFKFYINESNTRKSVFDPSITVHILYETDPEYAVWKKQFEKYGLAIGVPKNRVIVWDGEEIKKLSKDQILFIEAHEYSHFILGKNATEDQCDELAIQNLLKIGKKKAADIGVKNFYKRHGRSYK